MSGSPYVTLTEEHWPLLLVRFKGDCTTQQFKEYLDRATRNLAREDLHLIIFDLLEASANLTRHRQLHAEWRVRHDAQLRRTVLGVGCVLDSSFLRLTLNVAFHVFPPPYPFFFGPRLEPALEWGAQQLESAGRHEAARKVRLHFGLIAQQRTG